MRVNALAAITHTPLPVRCPPTPGASASHARRRRGKLDAHARRQHARRRIAPDARVSIGRGVDYDVHRRWRWDPREPLVESVADPWREVAAVTRRGVAQGEPHTPTLADA